LRAFFIDGCKGCDA